MDIILFIICIASVFNPQHDREVVAPILLAGYMCFQKYKGIPKSTIITLVTLFGTVITLSYFSTTGSSINYRPLFFQYLGLLTFYVIYVYVDFDEKIFRWIYYAGIVTSVWYTIHYYTNGYGYFNPIFMHKNVGGLFLAMVLALGLKKQEPGIYLIGYPVILWALVLTHARGAMLALCLAIIIFLIVKVQLKLLIIVVTCLAILAGIPQVRNEINAGSRGRIETTWPKMWEMVKENPIVGVGIGDMHVNSVPNNAGPHSHYLFLQSCSSVALILFLLIAGLSIARKRSLNLKLAMFIYLFYGIVSECATNTPPNQIIYWALIGFLNKGYSNRSLFIMPHCQEIINSWKKHKWVDE